MKIIVACDDAAGIRLIKSILASGHDIAGILTSSKGNSISSPYLYAVEQGIQVWDGANAANELFADTVVKEEIDLILSLRFPYIFSKETIGASRLGEFNLHTGLLPQYAGFNVSCWAIYNGESHHGVTLHKIESAIDTGAIVEQVRFEIEDNDTGLTLTKKSITTGISMIMHFLGKISRGEKISLTRQNLERRRYYSKAIPQQGCIDWEDKALKIFNFIRACDYYPLPSPWGIPQAVLQGEKIFICKARMTDYFSKKPPGTIRCGSNQEVEVATGDKWLRLELLKYRGKYLPPETILQDGAFLENGKAIL